MDSDSHNLRRIYKSATSGEGELRALLQSMFLGELMAPPEELWIVSPWVSNVVIVDNRAGSFDVVNPQWRHREIRLAEVVTGLMVAGCRFILVTRPDEHNHTFLTRLTEMSEEAAVDDLLTVVVRPQLHTKGILTGRGLLLGSMNLTYSGLVLNDEVVEYDTDPASRANARIAFSEYLKADQ